MILLLVTSIAVFANSILSDYSTSAELKNYAILMKQVTTTSIVPLAIMFIRRIRKINRRQHPMELLWIIAPVILGTASMMLYMLSGEESISELMREVHNSGYAGAQKFEHTLPFVFYVFTHIIFSIVIFVEILWFVVYSVILFHKEHFAIGNFFRFYIKRERIKTVELQYFYILTLAIIFSMHFFSALDITADFLVWNIVVSFLICFSMFAVAYIALFGSKKTLTRKEMRNGWRYNFNIHNKQEIVEEMMADLLEDAEEEALLHIQARIGENLHVEEIKGEDVITEPARAEHLFSTVAKTWEEDELFKRFQHLMVKEKIFLQPKLTLNDVANMLETNTTYVSKMVNNAYNLGFHELVNTLRIDYAEQYILNHRGAKQDEIATRCGFLSASSFNTIFKRITGVTPKIWIASADLQQKTRR